MAEPLRILVTNDDGIQSRGIIVLAQILREVGEVVVLAPDREQSATAHSLTLHRPLRVEKIKKNFYSVDGTPADCVHLALHGILSAPPQLIVSGINKGPNLGNDITYSGTVSAAFEGTLLGIPSIAVSLASRTRFKFHTAARFAAKTAHYLLKKGLPKDTFLNINVPNLEEKEINGYKITRQGRYHVHGNQAVEKLDPRGRKYYWIGGGTMVFDQGGETDYDAVSKGYVSITPLHIDLTNYAAIQGLRKWRF
jgi:5'-nucleotidase